MKTINEIVKEMIEQHEGGTRFFDNLDSEIKRNKNLIQLFLNRIVYEYIEKRSFDEKYDDRVKVVIASGGFARALENYGIGYELNYFLGVQFISVNGSLRKDEPIDEFGAFVEGKNVGYIFIDDSFYSGKTRDVIKAKIEEYDGQLLKTMVLYDGSKVKDESVDSMYRYYDNYEEG